jgi:hypothetical protein
MREEDNKQFPSLFSDPLFSHRLVGNTLLLPDLTCIHYVIGIDKRLDAFHEIYDRRILSLGKEYPFTPSFSNWIGAHGHSANVGRASCRTAPKSRNGAPGISIAFNIRIMGETPVKKLNEIRREYILRVLAEAGGDFKKASAVLKVSEKFLRKQVKEIRHIIPNPI